MYDDNTGGTAQYATSGLAEYNFLPRPAANYTKQVKEILGRYSYSQTINTYPFVDEYTYQQKKIYVLLMPTQANKREQCRLNLPGLLSVIVCRLDPFSQNYKQQKALITNGALDVMVTETPIFVICDH